MAKLRKTPRKLCVKPAASRRAAQNSGARSFSSSCGRLGDPHSLAALALQPIAHAEVLEAGHQLAGLVDAVALDGDAAGQVRRLPSSMPSTHAAAMYSANIASMRSRQVMGSPSNRLAVMT